MTARVTIGLPCHGRPALMEAALASLLGQSFRDFTLLIHENPSGSDHIRDLVSRVAGDDPRVVFHRHAGNIGITANFLSLVEACRTEFFMWAADDDLRHPEALAEMVAMLDAAPEAALAGFSVEVINLDGETIDFHPGFSRFTDGGDRAASLRRFLTEPELLGKANLAYGLFRAEALRAAFAALGGGFPACWGPDYVLLAALIARFPVVASDRVLIAKRTNKASLAPLSKRYPEDYGCPRRDFPAFAAALHAAMPDEATRRAAAESLEARRGHLRHPLVLMRRMILKALRLDSGPVSVPAAGWRWSRP